MNIKKKLLMAGTFFLLLVFSSCQGILTDTLDSGNGDGSATLNSSLRSVSQNGTNPVRLLQAQPFVYSAGGISWDQVYLDVHVENLGTAASRVVSIHWNDDGEWVTTPMELEGNYGTHSRYSLLLSGSEKEFCVCYNSSAGLYWDNNGGANYKVKAWSNTSPFTRGAVGGNVGLKQSEVTTEEIEIGGILESRNRVTVDLFVENMNYHKQVGIRYSLNNGQTWQDVFANYQYSMGTGGSDRIEVWKVSIGGLLPGSIRFALFYKDLHNPGTVYWDNNFTGDYHQSLEPFVADTIR